jgi:hypothetical protein
MTLKRRCSHTQYWWFVILNRRYGNLLRLLEKPILGTMRFLFFPFSAFRFRMTWSKGLVVTPAFRHCEANFVVEAISWRGRRLPRPDQSRLTCMKALRLSRKRCVSRYALFFRSLSPGTLGSRPFRQMHVFALEVA